MVTITFSDRDTKSPPGFLAGPFFRSCLEDGRALVPEAALETRPTRTFPLQSKAKQPMPNNWRRFEVLLPLQFNDGRDVPPEWLADAVLEIVDYFGAASYETQKVEGQWRSGGVLYRDTLVKIVVDVPERGKSPVDEGFKDRWKMRLEQLDLWLVSYVVDID